MIQYHCFDNLVTNESLEAIIKGLNPQSKDSILAICGSGDQAFAIIEKTNKITVVDNRACEIQYFLKRKSLLESEEFEKFLNSEIEPRDNRERYSLKIRNKYFSIERLKRIRLRLKKSEIKTIFDDIFNLRFIKGEFNKIYLSNALPYGYFGKKCIEEIGGKLQIIAEVLPKKGLIYCSYSQGITQPPVGYDYAKDGNSLLNSLGLRINSELTAKAQKLQFKFEEPYWCWNPVVLQKAD
ncbi:MAG: hypothetical protein AABW47_04220 [Nanoarchaeota archaeon]